MNVQFSPCVHDPNTLQMSLSFLNGSLWSSLNWCRTNPDISVCLCFFSTGFFSQTSFQARPVWKCSVCCGLAHSPPRRGLLLQDSETLARRPEAQLGVLKFIPQPNSQPGHTGYDEHPRPLPWFIDSFGSSVPLPTARSHWRKEWNGAPVDSAPPPSVNQQVAALHLHHQCTDQSWVCWNLSRNHCSTAAADLPANLKTIDLSHNFLFLVLPGSLLHPASVYRGCTSAEDGVTPLRPPTEAKATEGWCFSASSQPLHSTHSLKVQGHSTPHHHLLPHPPVCQLEAQVFINWEISFLQARALPAEWNKTTPLGSRGKNQAIPKSNASIFTPGCLLLLPYKLVILPLLQQCFLWETG